MIKNTGTIQDIIESVVILPKSEMKAKGIIPASTTSVETMDTCPKMFYAKYHQGMKGDINKGSEYGNDAHLAAEDYLRELKAIPDVFLNDLPDFQGRLDRYRALPYFDVRGIEQSLSIGSKGETDWRSRFMGVKADLMLRPSESVMVYVDHKTNANQRKDKRTGKMVYKAPDPKPLQLEMTAVILFLQYPEVNTIFCRLDFLRHGMNYTYRFDRSKNTYLQVHPTVKKMEFEYPYKMQTYIDLQINKAFYTKTSGLCKGWCVNIKCEDWEPRRT